MAQVVKVSCDVHLSSVKTTNYVISVYECAYLNSNPDQNLFYNLCKGSKHTYGAAGHYVSYLYCRSLSHVEITLMNAYIKGAILKQILRYLATFKRETC